MKNNHNNYPHSVYSDFLSSGKLLEYLSSRFKPGTELHVICDSNTAKLCFPILKKHINEVYFLNFVAFYEGEKHKNLKTCQTIWSYLSEFGIRKDSLIINLGGGITSDIGGFCASIYLRGIPFINIPTSLMAMVDGSLGGKTGVDLDNLKNILGVINFPEAVFIDAEFLKTLPRREFHSGYNEMIKHGLIADAEYFVHLTDNAFENRISEAIRKSVEIKMNIISEDPFDKGLRRTLNFGHTIGHAIETAFLRFSDKSVLHGEAILLGMIAESYLSELHGILSKNDLDLIIEKLKQRLLKVNFDKNVIDEILQYIMYDKKHSSSQMNFTLLEAPGKAVVNQNVNKKDIRSSLEYVAWLTESNTK
ncbi:MAG: 3-dehydroquinate synthase [Bacteroidetes bacterium]|nr:3-dehydroquinate synthase [Bacteroidota bacterium]